jgi:hypothetical protein
MLHAGDATDVVMALALLPGDEAREGLRRLMSRLDRLNVDADGELKVRAWRLVCRRQHLLRLLDRERVVAALSDESLDVVDRVLLLRAHPDADHQRATLMWDQDDLLPRFALDVLRATGPAQIPLATEALLRCNDARSDSAQAARTAAGVVVAGEAKESLDLVTCIAEDQDLPATLRAVASFVTDSAPRGDAFAERYGRWHEARPEDRDEGLVALLSGTWLTQLL